MNETDHELLMMVKEWFYDNPSLNRETFEEFERKVIPR